MAGRVSAAGGRGRQPDAAEARAMVNATCRHAGVPIAARGERTQQPSHSETRQLSHSGRSLAARLKQPGQMIEFIKISPEKRQAFCWHAGCWSSGVGKRIWQETFERLGTPSKVLRRRVQASRAVRRRGGIKRGKTI